MTPSERRIGATALRAVLATLLATGGNRAGQEGADLRRLAGALSATALDQVEASTFGPPLRACFRAATTAGATFAGMDMVRQTATGFVSDSLAVQRVVQTALGYALVEMCRICAATEFTSRQDVEAALARLNAAFGPAEEFAADRRNAAVYRALITLHGAVTRDLTRRARPLPRIVPFALAGGRRLLLTLAQRLHGDAGRAPELLAENRGTVHPLFMPAEGRALSA